MTATQVESKVMARSRQEGGLGTHTAGAGRRSRGVALHGSRWGHNDLPTLHIPQIDLCPAGGPTRLCPLWQLVVFHAIKLKTNCLFSEYTLFRLKYIT